MSKQSSTQRPRRPESILIVGSGGAGAIAGSYAQRTNPDAKIIVITKEREIAYRKPGIVKILEGHAPEMKGIILGDLMIDDGQRAYFKQRYNSLAKENIEVLRETEVLSLNKEKRVAEIQNLVSKETEKLEFDSIVLATGATATKPPLPGADLKGTFTMWSPAQANALLDSLESAKRALVVGVGFVGLETTEILAQMGIETFVAVRSRILRTLIEPDLSAVVMDHLRNEGVNFICPANIEKVEGTESVKSVRINGKSLPFDIVIFAAGARPNVELGTAIGCKLSNRAYLLDERLQTSVPGIYAAGNCADYLDGVLKIRQYLPVVRLAAYQGQKAGTNAAGGKEIDQGFIKGQIDHIAGLQIASIGHSSEIIKGLNIPHKVIDVSDKFLMFSGAMKPEVRLVLGKEDRLLGGQIIRDQFVGELAFLLYESIGKGQTADEFLQTVEAPVANQVQIARPKSFLDRMFDSS